MLLEGLLLIGSYFMGSIPFGLLLTQWTGVTDPRQSGSGNIGATNILRIGGRSLAFLTLVLDALKGALPVLFALHLAPDIAPLVGLCAVLGHIFPIWLRFQGGKGIATTLGIMLILSWPTAFIIFVIWAVVVFFTRYSSLASLCAAAACPFVLYLVGDTRVIMTSIILIGLIFYTHRKNVQRLFLRSEFKVGEKREE